jgi:hypothetical protein
MKTLKKSKDLEKPLDKLRDFEKIMKKLKYYLPPPTRIIHPKPLDYRINRINEISYKY